MDTMSTTTLLSAFYDVGDVIYQNRKNNQVKSPYAVLPERRATIGAGVNPLSKNRAVPSGAFIPIANDNCTFSEPCMMPIDSSLLREHRKLDRSMSEPVGTLNNSAMLRNQSQPQQQQQQNVNSSRYKTELCRPFEESGHCKYGDKCQFAHGYNELRTLSRHPKYKTELCRTFHTIGFCPYGPRCHFIHNEDERKMSESSPAPSNTASSQSVMINKNHPANMMTTSTTVQNSRQSPPTIMDHYSQVKRPGHFVSGFGGSLGSSSESLSSSSANESPSLSPTFWGNDDIFRDISNNEHFSSASSASCSSTSSPVFNFSADLPANTLANLLAPLNVNTTQMNQTQASDIARLSQQLNAIMNLNQCNSTPNVFDQSVWDVTPAPPSPPDSVSGDSIGSVSSMGSSISANTCGSPLDLSKSLRLPIFNQLSQDD